MAYNAPLEEKTGIEEVLSQLINDDPAQVGLRLVPGATGTGKTRAAVRQIAHELIEQGASCRRYVFVTNVKRNLPVKLLLDELKQQGHPELCDLVLYLDSNVEMLVNNLEAAKALMPSSPYGYLKRGPKQANKKYPASHTEFSIINLPEFLEAERRIKQLAAAKTIPASMDVRQMAINDAQKQLQAAELNLRRALSKTIGSICTPDEKTGHRLLTTREKRDLVENDSWWKWLPALYPSALTFKKRVIFMSLNKLLVKNSPIIEPSEPIWDSKLLDGSVVFIDEFELSKRIINEHLIDESVRQMADMVNVYCQLFDPFFAARIANSPDHAPNGAFSNAIFRSPSTNKGYGPQLRSMLAPIIEAAEQVYAELHLDKQFRLSDELRHRQQPFLFNDFQSRVISSENHQWATVHFLESYNEITLGSGSPHHNEPGDLQPQDSYYSIPLLLERLGGIVRWFVRWIGLAAENYRQVIEEDAAKGLRIETSFDDAVGTVLSELRIMDEVHNERNPTLERIRAMVHDERTQRGGSQDKDAGEQSAAVNLSLHQTGFQIHSFNESSQHDTLTRMERCALPCTAERKLVELSQRNLVIGISASLDIPTVLGNYDMDYVEGALGSLCVPLTARQRSLIESDFRRSICRYDKIDIRVCPVGDTDGRGDYSAEAWLEVFDSPRLARRAFNEVNARFGQPLEDGDSSFSQRRILRTCIAYKHFWEADDARAMLCILNKLPKAGDATLDLDGLKELFASILKHLGIEAPVDDTIRVLGGSSEDFERAKGEALARLAAGGKLFVITAYESAGAGQNLQYEIPRDTYPIKINDRSPSSMMDFDCLYLEAPTHTSPVIGPRAKLGEAESLGHILRCEYLYENAEITRGQLIKSVQAALNALGGSGVDFGYKDSSSSRLFAAQRIYQAVGRLGRTNMKMPVIRLFAQEDLLSGIPMDILRSCGVTFTPEFEALANALSLPIPPVDNEAKRLERKARLACDRSRACINSILGSGWHERARHAWIELGTQVLRYPTLPDDWAGPSHMERNYYVELAEKVSAYHYESEDDFRVVRILFCNKPSKRSFLVSAAASRLELLMRIPGMREHFEKQGYATSWAPSTRIMTPVVAESIYKGRLGEACGRFILEDSGIAVEEIEDPAKYEKFDFALPSNREESPVFIDFKHWKKPSDKVGWDSDRLTSWFFSKMEAIEAQRAIVANILPPDGERFQISMRRSGERRLLCVPSLVLADYSIDPRAIQAIRSFIHGDSD